MIPWKVCLICADRTTLSFKIRVNFRQLLKKLEPNDLVPYLWSKGFLSANDYERIGKCSSTEEKNEQLLLLLMNSSLASCEDQLCKKLQIKEIC